MTVHGDFNLGAVQSNKASVNFSCIQADSASAEMASAMSQTLMGEMSSVSGSEAAAKINSAAAAAQKSGFASGGGSASSADNTNITNNITNNTKVAVENIYQKNLKSNFSSETVSECIGRTTQNNSVSAEGTKVYGNVEAKCIQSNTLEQVQECKQLNEALNKTLTKTAQELGFTVETVNKTTTSNEVKSKSSSEQISTGPIQDLGNAVSKVLGSVGDLFGFAALGAAAPFAVSCCLVCCILISLSISMGYASSGKASTNAGSQLLGNNKYGSAIDAGIGVLNSRHGKHHGGSSDIEHIGINLISDLLSSSTELFDSD
ncbi:MAG: hypothetical protein Gaeavirus5_14 [Gaeavirus sp.]|uniref:Uncharacterized protein n=1 Tax=Gaeavirus sp. TaxID=2487767 RepID=A0A3G4ZYM5_9VIRU|nr:MAG: hypothetical protein Gaeavirus5_14 [Gaeavirus sp.]